MKRRLRPLQWGGCLFFLLIWLSSSMGAVSLSTEPERMRIAIVDFNSIGGDMGLKDAGSIVAEWLITSFVQSGRFEVVERSQLQKIVEEQKLALTGFIAQDTAVKLGKVLGVKVIISGTLIRMGEAIEINSRLIDTQDGSIIKAEKRRANRVSELENAVEDLATQIKGDFPLLGYVVNITDPEVMVDLGWKHGASRGQIFIVFREGKQIVHPSTNQVLAVEEIPVGEIRITKVDRITSIGAIIKQVEGKKMKPGDRVRTPMAAQISSGPIEVSPAAAPHSDARPQAPEPYKTQGFQFLSKWGGEGRDPGKFAAPSSLYVDRNNRIYIADTENYRIQVFDPQGQLLRVIGKKGRGTGEFSLPTDVAVDLEGNIYIVDSGNRRVQKFDSQGNFLLQWGQSDRRGEGLFQLPSGIAIGQEGSIYVADAKLGRIQCFDRSGNLLFSFGDRGRSPGSLSRPTHITMDAHGNLWVISSGNGRIQKFDRRGNFLASLEGNRRGKEANFVTPRGIAISSTGHVYVTDGELNRVGVLDENGTRLSAFGERGKTDGKFYDPVGIGFDQGGNIYVLERRGARIQKFSPQF